MRRLNRTLSTIAFHAKVFRASSHTHVPSLLPSWWRKCRNRRTSASEAIGTFTKSVNVKWWNWWDLSSVQFVYWFLVLYISICLLFVGFMTTFCRWLHLLFLMSLVPVEEKHPLQLHHPHLHRVTWTKLLPFCQYVSPELWNIYFVQQKCHDILFFRKKPS